MEGFGVGLLGDPNRKVVLFVFYSLLFKFRVNSLSLIWIHYRDDDTLMCAVFSHVCFANLRRVISVSLNKVQVHFNM